MIGKLDIGSSAEGFVRLIQEAVGPERRHEALYATMQFASGYEFNAFDLQVGGANIRCRSRRRFCRIFSRS